MDWVWNAAHSALFWTAVASSAAVALFFATLIPLWITRRSRPEPDWLLDGHIVFGLARGGDHYADAPAEWRAQLINAGDGPAFRVRVEARDATVGVLDEDSPPLMPRMLSDRVIALMRPGDEVTVAGKITGSHPDLVLRWTFTPTRLQKEGTHRMRLTEYLRDQRDEPD